MTGFLAAALLLTTTPPPDLVHNFLHSIGWHEVAAAGPVPLPAQPVKVTPAFRIVIDAGHGGQDLGAISPGGLNEKDVVLDVATRLTGLLRRSLNADIELTRADDTFLTLGTRVQIANDGNADLFLSIHANSSPSHRSSGIETYFDTRASRFLAHSVQASLSTLGHPSQSRGVKHAGFAVLAGAQMPAVLAEIGFLSNTADEASLNDPGYRESVAEALFDGITAYIGWR